MNKQTKRNFECLRCSKVPIFPPLIKITSTKGERVTKRYKDIEQFLISEASNKESFHDTR